MPDTTLRNLATADRYLKAIESGATGSALSAFLTPDVVQEEFPNRLAAQGARRDLAQLLEGAERGQQVLSAQRYEIRNRFASGDQVALELEWTGTLAVAFGELQPGSKLRAHIAVFLEFADGKIKAQRNYDCYEPW